MIFSSSTERCRLFCLFLIAVVATGCGGDEVKLVPAEGVLTINGRPADNISIQFLPDGLAGNKGPTSMAITDKQGKFRLQTTDGRDGAVPGAHQVVLADLSQERVSQEQEFASRQQARQQGKAYFRPIRLPSRYTQGIKATVNESGGVIQLNVGQGG